ncbi:MAG: hypothetical protein P8N40_02665 [Gammaproteobacteria bacterium]|nr:hypothetical protein [Gammaproteobacteria bacterium]
MKSIIPLLTLIMMLNSSNVIGQGDILRLSDIISADESVFEPLIQKEIENIEDDLIAAFNSFNEIEDFEVTCHRETQNGSYFFRACDPAFLIRERQANNVAWREGKEELLTKDAIKLKFQNKLTQLDEAFSKMLNEDEQAMKIANSLIALKEVLDSE